MKNLQLLKPSLDLLARRLAAFGIDLLISLSVALIFSFISVAFLRNYGDLWLTSFVGKVSYWAFYLSVIFELLYKQTPGKKILGLILTSTEGNYRITSLFLRNVLKFLPWMLIDFGQFLPLFSVILVRSDGGLSFGYMKAADLVQIPMNIPLVVSGFLLGAIYIFSTGLRRKNIYDRITKIDVVLKNELPLESVVIESTTK